MTQWKTTWGDIGELGSHQGYISNPQRCASTNDLAIGTVATFMYDGKPRFAFILNPSYPDPFNGKHKMHAATLKLIDRESILRNFLPNLHVAYNPRVFYETIYKPSSYDKDAYRTYLVSKVASITMFDYDPGMVDVTTESQAVSIDSMQEYFTDHYGIFAQQYVQRDRNIMYAMFKRGATLKEIETYYKGIVLKRFVAKYSDSEVMKTFFEEGT